MKVMATENRRGISTVTPMDIPTPEPGPGQIRVRVLRAALNAADIKVVEGWFDGRFLHGSKKPVIPGYDFSGVVDRIGPGVRAVALGDEVWGHQQYGPSTNFGSLAEFTLTAADAVAKKPLGVSHDTAAAAATAGLTALQGLRDKLRFSGGRVLVLGASGSVGTLAVGVAKRLGGQVTGLCSAYGVDAVKKLGADEVIDRVKQGLPANGRFEAIYDTPAMYSFGELKHLLSPRGGYVTTLPKLNLLTGKLSALFSRRRAEVVVVRSKKADLELLGTWLADGLGVPIAQRFPIKNVQAALEMQKRGGYIGKLVIAVDGGW